MNLTKEICRRAAGFEAVAFDVFDTLLKRDIAAPTGLFRLRGASFYHARIQAEQEARAAKSGEVTLAEIYARPVLTGYDAAAECAVELQCCVPFLPVLRAVQALKQQGKKIYFISDMYLPHEQICAMLRRCGYPDFDGGFVSCGYGVQKRSGGLFRRFLRETGLHTKDVLFIGDSWRADVLGAALARVPAWHLPQPPAPKDDLDAFIQNRLPAQQSRGQAFGFSVLGALCVAFCRWLHSQRAEHPGAKLFFLARDMYVMRAVYRILYPGEETFYLQVSRRSLAPAFLAAGQFDALAAALPRQQLTGGQIAAYCGTTCPDACADTIFELKQPDMPALTAFLQQLPPPKDRANITAYLRGQGIQSGDILVDIGSGGTTQLLLENLLHIQLHGMQLSADARLRNRFAPEKTAVFLFDGQPAPRLYWAGQPMLERLLSQDVGATLGYRQQGGSLMVCSAPHTPTPLLAEIQAGICNFAAAWKDSILQDLPLLPQRVIAPFLQVVETPSAAQVQLLGSLTVEDGGIYPLAAPQSAGYYLAHPKAAKQDLATARWKIGFLKQLLPLPLPYGKLYLALKK